MALNCFLRAYPLVCVQRQALSRYRPLLAGSVRCYSDGTKEDLAATQPKQAGSPAQFGRLGLTDHRVNRLERYLLVWGGKFKSLSDVPDLVSQDTMERARNKARIKINIMMCVATLFGCLAMIYAGKRARDAGESVIKMNEEFHREARKN